MNNRPIFFFGTEDFSATSLQKLIDNNFNIVGIITKPDSRRGRGQKIHMPAVKEIGEKYNIPVLQPTKMAEIIPFVQKFEKPAGVLVSFGRIIPQSIIELFTPGIINVHPSILPKYRGPSPIESAILNGDDKTGVTIMQLSKDMDAGGIYKQEIFNLDGTETSKNLYDKCGKIGSDMLITHLPAILEGKMLPEPQDDEKAVYCQLLRKEDSLLSPSEITAAQAERQIRAFEIFPKTKIKVGDYLIIINSARVLGANPNNSPLIVQFRDKKFLDIKKLTAPNGKQMDAESFNRGYFKK